MDQRSRDGRQSARGAPASWRGFYINLDRSTGRREALGRQFAGAGLSGRYVRFPAVDGASLARATQLKAGEIGCFASHRAVLEKAAGGSELVHILEDDAVLWAHLPNVVAELKSRAVFDAFDVVFTETMVNPDLQSIKVLKERLDAATAHPDPSAIAANVDVMDLATMQFSCASSYFVTPRGASRVLAAIDREWAAGPTLPYDFFLRREAHQGRLRMGSVFPFVTSIDLSEIAKSTLGRNDAADPPLILALLRYAFFVGQDLKRTQPILDDLVRRTKPDPQRQFLAEILGLIVSDRFRIF